MGEKEQFGAFIRRKREERELGLREMAKTIGISPTYLSKCERDEFDPPTEERIRRIAEILQCDAEELIARAGRVPADLAKIIKRHPLEMAALLRKTKGMSADDINRLASEAEKVKKR